MLENRKKQVQNVILEKIVKKINASYKILPLKHV